IVYIVEGGVGYCNAFSGASSCAFDINAGATVRIAAPGTPGPGRFSAGSGPAAACALSTCSFTMTGAADVTVTWAGVGPTSTITTTVTGDGAGRLASGGIFCERAPGETTKTCGFTYLTGSTIRLDAETAPAARFAGYSGATGPAAACGAQSRCDMVLDADA